MPSINPKANALFKRRYGDSKNILTPYVDARRMLAKGRLAVELSHGEGIYAGSEVWGVTVLIAADVEHRHDLSRSFATAREANAYIQRLRDWREIGDTVQ